MASENSLEEELARRKHIEFMRYTWDFDNIPFLTGFHIEDTCRIIDKAMQDYKNGISTFLCIKMPFRHHKSQTVTRSLVPHFLGEFPEGEVMVTAYSQSLVNTFSKDARSMVTSDKFRKLYPQTSLSKTSASVTSWYSVTGKKGKVGKTHWLGLGGSATGKGGNLIIVDDFLKGREDAEREVVRDGIWESFCNDFMTRRAPVSIVIVLATPWHIDDIFGRIKDKMLKDESFPRFTEIVYPAKSDRYPTGYLFPEKFSKDWYESQYATLGAYNASGLLDCDPSSRDGGLIPCALEDGKNWEFVERKPEGFGELVRGWDLASSSKTIQKDDPDFTVGICGAIKRVTSRVIEGHSTIMLHKYHIYIHDIVRIREEASQRNSIILKTAMQDSNSTPQYIESFGAYKDAYTTLKGILSGVRIVKQSKLKGDKIAKATDHLSMPFDGGNVFINRNIDKTILREFLKTVNGFPSYKHDDDVDALAVMVAGAKSFLGASETTTQWR